MAKGCLKPEGYTTTHKKSVTWSNTGILITKENQYVIQKMGEDGKMRHRDKPERPVIPPSFLEQTPYSTERCDLQGSLEMLGTSKGEPSWIPIWAKLIRNQLHYFPNRTAMRQLGKIEIYATTRITRGKKFHIDGGTFTMYAFQIVNGEKEHCFSASAAATITTWVTTLHKLVLLQNPSVSFHTQLVPERVITGKTLSDEIVRRARSSTKNVRARMSADCKAYITGKVQQNQLSYFNATSVLPPKELQSRKRANSGDATKIDGNKIFSEGIGGFSKMAEIETFVLVESATDYTQRRRKGEITSPGNIKNYSKNVQKDAVARANLYSSMPVRCETAPRPPPRRPNLTQEAQAQSAPKLQLKVPPPVPPRRRATTASTQLTNSSHPNTQNSPPKTSSYRRLSVVPVFRSIPGGFSYLSPPLNEESPK